jgi:hypothetical protein
MYYALPRKLMGTVSLAIALYIFCIVSLVLVEL